jgi:hypothetical protein
MHVQFGDCLTLLLVASSILAVRDDRSYAAGTCLGLAIAAKPWALPMAPLLLGLTKGRRIGALLAITIVGAVYLPFVLADPNTADANTAPLAPMPATLLALLDYSTSPSWVRPAQLTIGVLLAMLVVRRGHWQAAVLAAVVVRMILDPNDMPYYQAGLVAAALAWDGDTKQFPLATLLAFAYLLASGQQATTKAIIHLSILGSMLVWMLTRPPPEVRAGRHEVPKDDSLVSVR